MSNLLPQAEVSDSTDCPAFTSKIKFQKIITRDAQIGESITIRRALPHRDRRIIGAWCFWDHFGPINLQATSGLNIPPHPHMGLQTFTYLLAGKILHRDSLGSEQVIESGQVNLMTSGFGISHSEESVKNNFTELHGVQLWIALPDAVRHKAAEFAHYPNLPFYHQSNFTIKILVGEMFDKKSPVNVYSKLVCLHLHNQEKAETQLDLNPEFEYGILILKGSMQIDGQAIGPGILLYSAPGHNRLTITADADSDIFILGGIPFEEEILLWWNFVARNTAEISQAQADWENQKRFGEVKGYNGHWLHAPALP